MSAASDAEAALARLDAPGQDPTFVLEGRVLPLPDPTAMSWHEVASCLKDPRALTRLADVHGLSLRQAERLAAAWSAVFDLPTFSEAERLAGDMARHAQRLEADFARHYPGEDPHALWRDRQWRRLLNLIDHLPAHSYYREALAGDEEHAQAILDARDRAKREGRELPPSGPSMAWWTPEVDMLAKLVDATRSTTHAVIASNTGSDKPRPQPPKPEPRPTNVYERVKNRARQHAHDILVARMLPGRGKGDDQEE